MTPDGLRKAIAQFRAWKDICEDAENDLLRILAKGQSIDAAEVFKIVGQATWAIRKQVRQSENERLQFSEGSQDSGTTPAA